MRSNKISLIVLLALLTIFMAFSTMAIAATQRDYVVEMIKSAGMKDTMLGTEDDRDALAKNLGFFDNWNYNPTANVTDQVQASMDAAMANAYNGLRSALNKKPMEPYFVNGMAQPIFYFGNSFYYDTSGEGVIRFVVYVETDLDTDNDGKLDLVKTLVQLPRAVLDGSKLSTVFDARPYIAGRNSGIGTYMQDVGDAYLTANPNLSHADLYKVATPRIRTGEATLDDMVANANYADWYYRFTGSTGTSMDQPPAIISPANETNGNAFENLNWLDYFLVRGFAIVTSAGIGSAGSEGFSTCGSDVEINAYRCIVEWLTGDRKAYTDRVSNVEIKADWSNGNVGMTGRSYAGTTIFGMSTSGVNGLKTIIPVAGIASWYEYTVAQGSAVRGPYDVGLAWTVGSRSANPEWSTVFERYAGFSQLMRKEEAVLNGDYGDFWLRRDYTVENWFRDWGPSKIQTPMLIVHSTNDDNVRTKQSVMMYEAAKKAGVDIKWLWHQGDHMTPSWPPNLNATSTVHQPFSMYCGSYTYDEWLNMWFSHHLYDINNGIMQLMPGVLALDNVTGTWVSYDTWESLNTIVLNAANRVKVTPMARFFSTTRYEEPEDYSNNYNGQDFPPFDLTQDYINNNVKAPDQGIIMSAASTADDDLTVINSVNGSSSWQNFLDAPTAGSTVYHFNISENTTIKGVVKVNIKAAISSLGISADEPLSIHAKLVEIAAPGTSLKTYGRASNGSAATAMGSSPGYTLLKSEGAWQGGGLTSYNLVEFVQQTTATYREIAKGWMDLCNPSAVFDSYTADRKDRIIAKDNIGVYHNYSLFLQPTIHTATKGNKLALIITTGVANTAAYTGNNAFTFTIDNDATNAVIPIANTAINIDTHPTANTTVTEGRITGSLAVTASVNPTGETLTYQWYSNTASDNTGGTAISGATNSSFTIPTTLTAGTYYYFCEVSAAGAGSVRSNVGTVTVNKKGGIADLEDEFWDLVEGCNVFGIGALFLVIPFILIRRKL